MNIMLVVLIQELKECTPYPLLIHVEIFEDCYISLVDKMQVCYINGAVFTVEVFLTMDLYRSSRKTY